MIALRHRRQNTECVPGADKKKLSRNMLLFLMLSVLFFIGKRNAHASIVQAMSLEDMRSAADVVLVVDVLGQKQVIHSELPHQRFHLRVVLAVKGAIDGRKDLYLRTLGGQVERVVTRVQGEPVLVEGERYLIFARRWKEFADDLRPVGLSQGVLEVRRSPNREWSVCPNAARPALVERLESGELAPSPGPVLQCIPWQRVQRRLRVDIPTPE